MSVMVLSPSMIDADREVVETIGILYTAGHTPSIAGLPPDHLALAIVGKSECAPCRLWSRGRAKKEERRLGAQV